MKKKPIIILSALAVIIMIIAVILLATNKIIESKNKLEIIDATFKCAQSLEQFYEDEKYIYSFPCVQSSSIYVKFENGNKMLVIDALDANKVTIDELIEAGLEVRKQNK